MCRQRFPCAWWSVKIQSRVRKGLNCPEPPLVEDFMLYPHDLDCGEKIFHERVRDTPNDQVKGAIHFLLACWIIRDDVLAHSILTCTHPVDNGSSVLYHDKKFMRVAGLLFLVKLELHQDRMVAPQ